jgi:acyl carrier protein
VASAAVAVKAAPVRDIKALLLQVVSDKTGYPQEMLGMEMDLEADLSIDSIKRVEIIGTLRSELGTLANGTNEDMVMEQLAGIKTLSGLVSWLTEFSGADATTAPEKNGTPAEAASKPQAKSALTLEDLQNAILNIVSEKTGYPKEMLGLDLDLEADLSIDSIKRMEIIADLKNKIGFGENLEQADDVMEKLAAIKTLRGLASWISEMSGETNETKTKQRKLTPLRLTIMYCHVFVLTSLLQMLLQYRIQKFFRGNVLRLLRMTLNKPQPSKLNWKTRSYRRIGRYR